MSDVNTRLRLIGLALPLLVLVFAGAGSAHNEFVPRPDAPPVVHSPSPPPGRLEFINEGFEGSWPVPDWANMTTGTTYTWDQTSSASQSGSSSAWVHYGPQGSWQDEWLITPALDLSTATAPALEFYEHETYWADYGDHHYIAVSTTSQTDPAAFTMIETWTPANHTISGFGGDPVLVDLGAYAGEPVVYVAFRYTGDWADDWYIDDVRVFEPSDHDVMAVAALPDGEQYAGGATVTPQAVVANVGLNTETFDVQMEILESGAPLYSETVGVVGLNPGEEVTVDFPDLLVDTGHYYKNTVTTLLVGDEDPSNDVATGAFNTYTEPHVPLGILFTNSGCGPCVSANQALDTYTQTSGNNIALLRVHTWWPNPGDIMFLANEEQCTDLTNEYGVSGVPHFFVDRLWDLAHTASDMIAGLDEARTWFSPMNIGLIWYEATQQLEVTIEVANALDPDGDYELYCAITEDNIFHNGGNGEPIHMQAFRYMYPDHLNGVSVPPTTGYHQFIIDCPLDATWVYDELRASVYVIDRNIGKVWQSGTAFLTEIGGSTPVILASNEISADNGEVTISWRTSAEENNLGFHVDRSEQGIEGWQRLTGDRIESTDERGASYEFVDCTVSPGKTYTYRLEAVDRGGDTQVFELRKITVANVAPRSLVLHQNQPNPFNPMTRISFEVPAMTHARLRVFDTSGHEVRTLIDRQLAGGHHTAEWDGRDDHAMAVGSGIYLLRLEAGATTLTRKLVLVR